LSEPPGAIERRIKDGPFTLTVTVTRDKRLRTSARWTLRDDTIDVRVPAGLPSRRLEELLDDVVARVLRQRARARRRNDGDLERRAQALNRAYFGGELRWHSIRWVSNMTRRLGSCTSGGATDGDIRIIAHELAHRKHPNHSLAFWDYLARYPHVERARGFIEGIAYGQGASPDDLL